MLDAAATIFCTAAAPLSGQIRIVLLLTYSLLLHLSVEKFCSNMLTHPSPAFVFLVLFKSRESEEKKLVHHQAKSVTPNIRQSWASLGGIAKGG